MNRWWMDGRTEGRMIDGMDGWLDGRVDILTDGWNTHHINNLIQ